MIVSGQELTGDVSLGRGEHATVRLTVRNHSTEPVHNVLVSSHVTNTSSSVGTLAPGTTEVNLAYTAPLVGSIIDGSPSAYSAETGTISGPAQRVIVSCDAFQVQPLFELSLQNGLNFGKVV